MGDKKVKDHHKGFLKGTVAGLVLGGIAAILFAPKSGKETQADLKRQAKKVVKDVDQRLIELEGQLDDRIGSLKVVAENLKGEAYEDSQRLITRAEILKTDLKESVAKVATTGKLSRDEAIHDVKRLVGEGAAVMHDLERMTKRIVATAKDGSAAGERVHERKVHPDEE